MKQKCDTMKKIIFLTGTRADFGKLKPLIQQVERSDCLESHIFATGMHMLPQYGTTAHEILKCEFNNVYFYNNRAFSLGMDITLANTIYGFSCYIKEVGPDLIVVHGDRAEALAGAIVGSFNNIRVAHIEGGEVSGTLDELIRHSVTKLSHVHFVANERAHERLIQLGEKAESVFVVGSPEIDIMLSDTLPSLEEVVQRYDIPFHQYGILIYHPVTTEANLLHARIRAVVDAVLESGQNYIVILPNNDAGSEVILKEYKRFEGHDTIRVFPSIRFEYFLTLFKHSRFMLGNSSAGVRQAQIYGIPSINCGTRQDGRNTAKSIFTVPENKQAILRLVNRIVRSGMKFEPKYTFGNGNSTTKIMQILNSEKVWELPLQKRFEDTCVGQGRPISPVGIPAISKIQDADILRQSEYVLEKV
jgi:UDP-N-acetylglucosamine 2-epimerase (hydrolysing)